MQFADFGFGTVVGTLITAGVAIFVDHLRRRDERKNRFLDKKRRVYKDCLHYGDLMANELQTAAALMSAYEGLKLQKGGRDPADLEHVEQLTKSVNNNVPKHYKHLREGVTEMSLIWPATSVAAGNKLLDVLETLMDHAYKDEYDKVADLIAEYDPVRDAFRKQARRDLGTNH